MAKTQGRHGEVAADLHSDFPERFEERKRVFALAENGTRRELEIEGFWPHKGRIVLKFGGIETISDAEALLGAEIQIPIAERALLEDGTHYVSDLVGCEIVVDYGKQQRVLGRIRDVQFGAGEAPLLIIGEGKQEILIPFVTGYTRNVDVAAKRIDLVLPEGMLEINSPMSEEEKRQQQKGSERNGDSEE